MATSGNLAPLRVLVLAMSCVIASCATTTSDTPAGRAVEFPLIEYQVTSWGQVVARATVSPDGVVVRQEIDPSSGETTTREEAQLSPDDHRAAVAALEPLRQSTRRDFGCPRPVATDLPTANFSWDGSERLRIYFGCYDQLPELAEAERTFWEIVDGAFSDPQEPERPTKE